jgi:hypothetical protein
VLFIYSRLYVVACHRAGAFVPQTRILNHLCYLAFPTFPTGPIVPGALPAARAVAPVSGSVGDRAGGWNPLADPLVPTLTGKPGCWPRCTLTLA